MIHRADKDERLGKEVRAHYLRRALTPLDQAIRYLESIPWRGLAGNDEHLQWLDKYEFLLAQAIAFCVEATPTSDDLSYYRGLTARLPDIKALFSVTTSRRSADESRVEKVAAEEQKEIEAAAAAVAASGQAAESEPLLLSPRFRV